MSDPVEVSFVIPAKNEAQNIGRCLSAIRGLACEASAVEIVVMDNGSDDGTVDVAAQLADRVEVHPRQKVGWLRNRGAQLARGRFLAFVDADCEIKADWLREGLEALRCAPNSGAVGNFYSMPPNASWIQKAWNSTKTALDGNVSFLPAGNFLIRKSTFEGLGGFNGSLESGEDYDLFVRLRANGGAAIAVPGMISLHYEKVRSLIGSIRREYWYGKGMLETFRQGEISKPFIVALGQIFAFAAAVTLLVTGGGVLAPALVLLALPILMSLAACARVKRFRYVAHLVPIFFCYLLGRIGAIGWLAGNIVRRRTSLRVASS